MLLLTQRCLVGPRKLIQESGVIEMLQRSKVTILAKIRVLNKEKMMEVGLFEVVVVVRNAASITGVKERAGVRASSSGKLL